MIAIRAVWLLFCNEFLWSSPAAEQHVFKQLVLHASLLGLDLLAAQKRHEKEHQASGGKCYKDSADGEDSPAASQEQQQLLNGYEGERDGWATSECSRCKDRHYHSAQVETPPHTGGVSKEVWECSRQREWEHREQGVYTSSKKKEHRRVHGRERDYERKRDRDEQDRSWQRRSSRPARDGS